MHGLKQCKELHAEGLTGLILQIAYLKAGGMHIEIPAQGCKAVKKGSILKSHFFVQAYNGCHTLPPEVVPVIFRCVKTIARYFITARCRPTESKKLPRHDPVEVSIFHLGRWVQEIVDCDTPITISMQPHANGSWQSGPACAALKKYEWKALPARNECTPQDSKSYFRNSNR
jgi:hypothetical protein